MSISTTVKAIQDIMRKDAGVDLTFPVIFLFQRNRQYSYRHKPYSSVAYCH
ncbi:hypothetical protein FEV09_20440 [Pseudanabaena catenata USMAC16]|uniref:Uncharacterized protein n=2 Tax=Pseudanabaena TaxID=1152 RepID=L8MVL4_9CYAN|nr:hypothetical protein [Pseudanabaena catenata]ELS30814.1 hypothetical protein Pse7429DRAFT_4001 [Pseudanabaena biceps PCC 7429]MDG3496912.1 hypothetical protein [Pseudanabaena catenata USMAC16]